MKRIFTFEQLFEWRTGEKHNKKWNDFENMMALYYYKTDGDLSKLGITNNEDFANKYIGTNEDSIKMQSKCFQFLQTGEGLRNYSKSQSNVNKEFGKYSEQELRKWILEIMDNITDEQIEENIKKADYKNDEIKRRKEEKKAEENKQKRTYTKRKDIINKDGDTFDYQFHKKKLSDIKNNNDIFVEIGDILNHRKFGKGEVIKKDNSIIEIDFFEKDLGIKKLLFNPEHYIWRNGF